MRRRLPRWILLPVLVLGVALGLLLWRVVAGRLFGVNLDRAPAAETTLTLPPGFQSTVFARDLSDPRFMTQGPDGTIFVAERGQNRVLALRDTDGDGRADSRVTVADGLHAPSSLAFTGDRLLVGEQDAITALTLDSGHRSTSRTHLVPDLPDTGTHTTKTVLVAPDGHVFVAVGSSCNVCQENDPRRAAVWIYNGDGTGGRLYSKGLRNAVGLALNPTTGAIWATNNGRDLMGDHTPPETVYVLRDGADFGWPRCHAGTVVDPDFGAAGGCAGVVPPVAQMAAHMAPLGLTFYTGAAFPPAYRDSLYIAFHGSWNSSRLVGYKVMRVPLQGGAVAGPAEDFATGWLASENGATGRPAGVTQAADGSLLVSDDKAGYIYRIAYTGRP